MTARQVLLKIYSVATPDNDQNSLQLIDYLWTWIPPSKNTDCQFITKPIYWALSFHDEKLLTSGLPHHHQEEDDLIDPAESFKENGGTSVQAAFKHQAVSQIFYYLNCILY